MVEADIQIITQELSRACLEKIQKQNQLHKEYQGRNTEEISEAKYKVKSKLVAA
jgi:hypothetical protein